MVEFGEVPASGDVIALHAAGTSLLLDPRTEGLPVFVHWGRDLGTRDPVLLREICDAALPGGQSNSVDVPRRVELMPQRGSAYAGRATLVGSRQDGDWSTRFDVTGIEHRAAGDDDGGSVAVLAEDPAAGLRLRTELELGPAGVLTVRHRLRNTGAGEYQLDALPVVLPVPPYATELLDFTGRHLRERVPQRQPFGFGSWDRSQRRGRTGHDAPLLLAAGTEGFGFGAGEVWAVHVAWSGDATTFAERLPEAWSCLGGAELLQPLEIRLAPGEEYVTPLIYAAHSVTGLDGISAALHQQLRARPGYPRRPRPVLLNTWEAVYFDHDLPRLVELAERAAECGVERFVLDDGWFGGRRDDTAGLGDWDVSAAVWPDGLDPLVSRVTELGMEFGIWVEPEMVNPDSDLARRHPDWLLAAPGRLPPAARHQHALDLARPEVAGYLLEKLDALLRAYPVKYLKWDHNRDLVDPVTAEGGRRRPGMHAQTTALYRLLDDVRERHPGVEIESCAGGGGRVDLEILQRTDRIWTSDNNDPLERQQIQRWTTLLVPPELTGAHVGPPRAHTTGRVADLGFRAGTAFFGHLGVEWDLTTATEAERAELAGWIALHKRFRPLLHGGRVVRLDGTGPAALVHGVVAADRGEAVFGCVQLDTTTWAPPPAFRLPGLDPERVYRVAPLLPGGPPRTVGDDQPAWWVAGGASVTGAALAGPGLSAPVLMPQQLVLLHAVSA